VRLPECKNITGIDALARTLDYMPETKLLVVAEENIAGSPKIAKIGDNQVIRVFANALYQVTSKRPVDPNWEHRGRAVQQYESRVKRLDVRFDAKLKEVYQKALDAGKWKGTAALSGPVEYWVKGVLAYFD